MDMITKTHYDWTRYWIEDEGKSEYLESDLHNFSGFLTEFGVFESAKSKLKTIQEINHYKILGLLGEPGTGKTDAIREEIKRIEPIYKNNGDYIKLIDLNSIEDRTNLKNEIFDNQDYNEWVNGSHSLYVFLDSFDEVLIDVNKAAQIIIDFLRNNKIDWNRFYLRIACRPAVWPTIFDKSFPELLDDPEQYAKFKLGSLQSRNVLHAAKQEGFDDIKFLDEIIAKDAIAFANTPFKLVSLIQHYKINGQIPDSRQELFESQIINFCKEQNDSRISSGHSGKVSPEKRMKMAANIAAIMLFSGKNTVSLGNNIQQLKDFDFSLNELIELEIVENNEERIRQYIEVLDTPLFTSFGQNRFVWSHRIYAEFLAAWHCKEEKIPNKQLQGLLFHNSGKIIPQLSHVATWLANFLPDLRNDIIANNPDVLIRIDPKVFSDDEKEKIVDRLLESIDNVEITHPTYYTNLNLLSHAKLGEQLKAVFLNKAIDNDTRYFAIEFAKQCNCLDIQNDILEVALNKDEVYEIRCVASETICKIGSEDSLLNLKPLIEEDSDSDLNDTLKGNVFNRLWPNTLSTLELFTLITPIKNNRFSGSYRSFLYELPEKLKEEDFIYALLWTQLIDKWDNSDYARLPEQIFEKSLKFIENEQVAGKLAETLLKGETIVNQWRFINNDVVADILKEDSKARRILFSELVQRTEYSPEQNYHTYHFVLLTEDSGWAIEKLSSIHTHNEREKWGIILRDIFRHFKDEQKQELYSTFQDDNTLASIFSCFSGKEIKSRKRESEKEISHIPQMTSEWLDPKEKIERCLKHIKSKGKTELWNNIASELTRESKSSSPSPSIQKLKNLSQSPGWVTANSVERDCYIKIAVEYLEKQDPLTDQWIRTRDITNEMAYGYAALKLIADVSPEILDSNDGYILRKWNSVLWKMPLVRNRDDEVAIAPLLTKAISISKTKMTDYLISIIDGNSNGNDLTRTVPKRVKLVWNPDFEKALTLKAYENSLRPECFFDILETILENGSGTEVMDYALDIIERVPSNDDPLQRIAVYAAKALFRFRPIVSVTKILDAINRNDEFGKEFFMSLANNHGSYFQYFFENADEEILGKIFISLTKIFPYNEDPPPPNGIVSSRQHITRIREMIFEEIYNKNTQAGVNILETLSEEFPEINWLKWRVPVAKQNLIANSWNPPTMRELFALFSDPKKRIVNTEKDLQAIVLESLTRIQAKISNNQIRHNLDFWTNKPYRSKGELEFSRIIANDLRDDLKQSNIIVNREPLINVEDKTDIKIEVPCVNESNPLTVIIECKGCWNKDLQTAMENQLLGQYLNEYACTSGIYLIGWYCCEDWDEDCPKHRKKMGKHKHDDDLEQTIKHFEAEAKNLSKPPYTIKSFVLDVSI